jgi:hypothetical protein
MIFSVVEIETYHRCERRWGLQSENMSGLEAVKTAPALVLGSLIHSAIEDWTNDVEERKVDPGYQVKAPEEAFMAHAADYEVDTKAAYKAQVGADIDESELQGFYEGVSLGQQMAANYMAFYKTPLPKGYELVQTEQRTIVPIPGTEHLECNKCQWMPSVDAMDDAYYAISHTVATISGSDIELFRCDNCNEYAMQKQPHYLRGTIDSLVRETRTGKLLGLERKTYAIRPTVEKLQQDHQTLAYNWVLQQLFGVDQVGGILYDGLWKRPLSKRHPKLEELFFRHHFIRPQEEIDEFERLLCIEVQLMAAAKWRGLENLTINRRWEGCYDCGVQRICTAMSRGEDVDYVIDTWYRKRPSSNSYAGDFEDSAPESE